MVSAKIRIEQFYDPNEKLDDMLTFDDAISADIGDEVDLEDGYSIVTSDYDEDEGTITIGLEKNGNLILEKEDMEEGDVFSYYRNVDGTVTTIFIATIYDFFETSDSEIIFLREVSQHEDVEAPAGNVEIRVEGSSGNDIQDGDRAIIWYGIDSDASKVTVYLDNKKIDARYEVNEGTYPAVTEKLDSGTYVVKVESISTEGGIASETYSFTVEGESDKGEDATGLPSADDIEDILPSGNVSDKVSDSVEDVKNSSIFSYVVVALLIALTAFFLKREFS